MLVICIILAAVALALTFRPYVPAAVIAYLSLLAGRWSGDIPVTDRELLFWAAVTVLVSAISALLPKEVSQTSRGMGYIAGGTLAGAAVGLLLSQGGMIAAAAAGAFLGALAYSRTPAGKPLSFPSQRFLQYLCAKGLPAIVAIAITGIEAYYLLNI